MRGSKNESNAAEKTPDSLLPASWPNRIILLILLVYAVVVFRVVLPADQVLFSTDDAIGVAAYSKSQLPHGILGRWDDNLLVGAAQAVNLSWTAAMMWLLPITVYVDWIHAIDLILGSFFLILFLREHGKSPLACLVGALTAYWCGSTFTLVFAGHVAKFGTMMWAGLCLWLIRRSVTRSSLAYRTLAGGAMGAMFLEQPDLALFLAFALGAYAVYAVVSATGRAPRTWVKQLLPIVVVAFLVAFRSIATNLSLYSTPETKAVSAADPKENWNYCTQWSWPPDETIEFIAPGYMGWRSSEPAGPYWGRLGRSAEWEQTKQGFQNFKLETFYLGAIPLVLAVFTLCTFLHRKGERVRRDHEPLFWGGVALVTFLLALGKFFPLYWLFYHLPGMSSIRNPVKFMQVTQLALGILAAWGFDELFRGQAANSINANVRRRFILTLGIICGVLALLAIGTSAFEGAKIAKFTADGWGESAPVIVENMIRAWWHVVFLTVLALGAVATALRMPRGKTPSPYLRYIPWAVVVVMAADFLYLARHYVQAQDLRAIQENEVVDFLKSNLNGQRVALVSQGGFYNHWLTYLFPYHGLEALNVTQLRMPEDYQAFLSRVGVNSVRMWQLCAVGYLLGPAQIWGQVQQDPALKEHFDLVYAFNVYPEGQGVGVRSATAEQPGQHCILKFKLSAARYALFGNWEIKPDDEVLKVLADPAADVFSRVFVAPDTPTQPAPLAGETPIQGSIQRQSYRPGMVELQVSANRSCILRLADKYSPDWKATMDGKPAPVLRCDYLFLGVRVEPGLHKVVLKYAPENTTLWVQVLGMGLCMVAAGFTIVRRDALNRIDPA